LLLDSGSLIKNNSYRRDKLLRTWVAHLAGHLGGEPLTTVVVAKTGTATLPPLDIAQARDQWRALLDAWRQGMRRPLPLATGCGFAWLAKGDAEAARDHYERDDGERDCSPYLARAFPDFDALWAGGEFARLAEALLRPLDEALRAGKAPPARTGDEG
jgi:exodeoxyribonuclease V gamma subunit